MEEIIEFINEQIIRGCISEFINKSEILYFDEFVIIHNDIIDTINTLHSVLYIQYAKINNTYDEHTIYESLMNDDEYDWNREIQESRNERFYFKHKEFVNKISIIFNNDLAQKYCNKYNYNNFYDEILEQEITKCSYEKINKFYNDLNEKKWWVFCHEHDKCIYEYKYDYICNLCKIQKKFYKNSSYNIINENDIRIYYLNLINVIIDVNTKNMKKRIESIEEENNKLKTHIECMPDGEKYFEAKEHYESLAKGNMKN